MDLITVIVPVYKAEGYLQRCIDSIINQTYKDIEVILVDDGSPDNCGEICDRYANKDSRVKVIHRKNGGVSSARNEALNITTGKYVMFVDADDYIENKCIETLYKRLIQDDIDLVLGKSLIQTKHKDIIPDFYEVSFFGEQVVENIFKIINLYGATMSCSKLFKTEIIRKNSLRFDTNVTIGEDSIFVAEYIEKIDSFSSVDEIVYYYDCKNNVSATKKYYENYCEYSKAFTDIIKRILGAKERSDFYSYMTLKLKSIIEHYLFRSPGFISCVENVKKTIEMHKEDINFDLFKNIYTQRQIDYLSKGKYNEFVLNWRLNNFVIFYKSRIKGNIKKLIYKAKNRVI